MAASRTVISVAKFVGGCASLEEEDDGLCYIPKPQCWREDPKWKWECREGTIGCANASYFVAVECCVADGCLWKEDADCARQDRS